MEEACGQDSASRSTASPAQTAWIQSAGTFFVASAHPTYGTDASHRGGNPGFVDVDAPTRLTFPDDAGNGMFNTLGNITVNPRVGLLFVDFDSGSTLHITGQAAVIWDPQRVSQMNEAERAIELTLEEVVEIRCSHTASH